MGIGAQARKPAGQLGVSLIEALVALLILAFGLIAVALLQTNALQNNFVSNQYTVAASIAQGLSEAMRANRRAVLDSDYDLDAGDVPAAPPLNCAEENCPPEARAQWDLAAAYASISSESLPDTLPPMPTSLLPSGQLEVTCSPEAATLCGEQSPRIITVYWDADRGGASTFGCDPASTTDYACFRLVHIP